MNYEPHWCLWVKISGDTEESPVTEDQRLVHLIWDQFVDTSWGEIRLLKLQRNRPTHLHKVILGSTETSGVPVSAMKLVNRGGGGGSGGGGGGAGVGGGGEKTAFSFKKCSAFQFVKRKVRRWMRNPKVSVEKAQGKALLYPCPKCPLSDDLWCTHFPSPYGGCHYGGLQGGQYYHQEPCSSFPASGQSGHDKNKTCKVRKWKMLACHHGDSSGKQKEEESDVHLGGCQSWGIHASPLLASPVMLECSICSGPYISYGLEDTWQPRQRTQAMDLYYHNDSDPDSYCWPGDNTFSSRSPRPAETRGNRGGTSPPRQERKKILWMKVSKERNALYFYYYLTAEEPIGFPS
ncbi:uncharacterized protein [Antennarius striatus]|uniref:uncharacterized protein n=1 Tax=Antennarius striatus TaxID=241820 RepID=UPI0035AE8937